MKPDLMDILVCPVCKGDFALKITKEEAGEIIEGTLNCAQDNETYQIEDGIPNLLPHSMRD